jgi:hypothetical protein
MATAGILVATRALILTHVTHEAFAAFTDGLELVIHSAFTMTRTEIIFIVART